MSANNELDLRRFIRGIKKSWLITLICAAVFLGTGITYWFTAMPQYMSYSEMLIEDSSLPSGGGGGSKGAGMASLMRSFSIGGFGSNNTANEEVLINTRQVFLTTVKDLGINRAYIELDGLGKRSLYKETPIIVEASPETFDKLNGVLIFNIDINGDKADIQVKKSRFSVIKEIKGIRLPATIKLPQGTFQILRTPHFDGGTHRLRAIVSSYDAAARALAEKVKVRRASKLNDAISFSIKSGNKEYGEAVLNTLMGVYNDIRLKRRQQNATEEIEFLDNRIASLFTDLNEMETNISAFKEANNLMAIDSEAEVLVENATKVKTEVVATQAEMLYYQELLNTLNSPARRDELLPVFDEKAYPMIKDYNELIQTKRQIERSAKEGNATLDMINSQIGEMRTSVIENVENMLQSARIKANAESGLVSAAQSRLQSLPAVEKQFLSMLRDQKLKNELYMFLLEKRESAILQLYSTSTLGFVIDEAYSGLKPDHSKQYIVLAIAFLLTLLVPSLLVVTGNATFCDKIYSPIDLAKYGVEENAFMAENLGLLRNKLIHDGRTCLYIADFGITPTLAGMLHKSFRDIGMNAEIISGGTDNDALLTRAFAERMSGGDRDAAITAVPDPANVPDILNIVDKPDAAVIALLPYGRMKRPEFRKIFKGFPAENVYAVITDKNAGKA